MAEGLRLAGGPSLARAGDTLLACSGSALFAFDRGSGRLRWATSLSPYQSVKVLAADRERIYVSGEKVAVQALDARSGRRLWSAKYPYHVQQVVPGDNLVYIVDTHSKKAAITTLRATDGSLIRSLTLRHAENDEQLIQVTADGMAYFQKGRYLLATRLEDEREMWRSEHLRGLRTSDEAFHSGLQLSCDGRILAYAYRQVDGPVDPLHVGVLDQASGTVIWHWQSPDSPKPVNRVLWVAATGDLVYVSDSVSGYGFNSTSGQLLWEAPVTTTRVFLVDAATPLRIG